MDAWYIRLALKQQEGKRHDKGRPLADARVSGPHCAAVEFRDLFDNRQSETEAAMPTRLR